MLEAIMDLGQVFTKWRVWWLLASQDIVLRYKRSVLGPFWISGSLAMLLLGLSLLYGAIFEQEFRTYLFFLASGFLAWVFLSVCMSEGCTALIESEHTLRALPIRTPLIAARIVARNTVILLHNAVVVAVVLLVCRVELTPGTAMALPGLILTGLISFAWALVVAPFCLRFRDLTQVVANFLQLSFFLTPIMWPPDVGRVPAWVLNVNPFYHLIELVRAPLLGGAASQLNWTVGLILFAVLITLGLISVAVSRRKLYYWL